MAKELSSPCGDKLQYAVRRIIQDVSQLSSPCGDKLQ